MATTNDIRDIMDLDQGSPRRPAPKKKKKNLEMQPRLSGISREVQALMGDSVPPVAIVETPKYKQKPSMAMKLFRPRHWDERSFVHGARKDGLQLKHWKRSIPVSHSRPVAPTNSASDDVTMTDTDHPQTATPELQFEEEFPSERWDVQVQVHKYGDEQYEKFFKSEEWTREETDHLMRLCQDYNLRWVLIADRYDPTDISSTTTDSALRPPYPQRSTEELKQRYYAIAAKMLEAQTPASNMTQTEFQLWEKMRNFDARTETQRKVMAEKLFDRTKEEADEEKVLLEELYRITKHEDDFIKMRKDLYSRLETAPSLRRNERGEEPSTAIYQTSQGLGMLLSSLLAKEKRLKTRIAPNGQEAASASQTPVDAQKSRQGNQYSRRETMDSNAGDDHGPPTKKASVSQAPVIRTLSPAEEVKFGVGHPQERLTSGVMFRHEKINRLTMAKSQVQTQKIGAALTELAIPPRLLMPTERVCREFERLVSEVQILLDTRRVLEKVSNEVRVLEDQKQERLGGAQATGENGEQKAGTGDGTQMDSTAVSTGAAAADASAAGMLQKSEVETSGTQPASSQDTAEKQTEDKARAEVDDSQIQADEDDDDEPEVDPSAMADDDEDNDDAGLSFAQHEDDEDEEEEEEEDEEAGADDDVILDDEDEDEDDDDDVPGLEDLEKAHQVTDDEEDEEEEEEADDDNDNEIDPSQLAEDDDDDDDDDEDEDQANADHSILNGGLDDEGNEEIDGGMGGDGDDDDNEESRPASSHSNPRGHKRSASVLSVASRAESSRSAASRKKRR